MEQAGYDRISREHAEAIDRANREIEAKTAALQERTRESELAAAQEIEDLRADYAKREALKLETDEKLEDLCEGHRDKINRDWDEQYAKEVTSLQRHLAGMLEQQMTPRGAAARPVPERPGRVRRGGRGEGQGYCQGRGGAAGD